MADQRSVMKEYRLLEQKRQSGGLTAQEETRFEQLRDLAGPEAGAVASRPGFDVNAAAARLRESLLPAGLRDRSSSPPEPAPEPPRAPEPEPAGSELEAQWNAAPFAPLSEQPGLSADALFDPETLGSDAPAPEWDPNAQPLDPNVQPYDPNAPQQWDAAAQGWGPGAQQVDPNAPPYDPNAPQQWDAAQGWDPGAQQYDPNAPPYDPNAPQQWDAAAQGWDPGAQQYDPNAPPYDAAAQPWDPQAAPQWEAAVQPAWDPNLAPPWGEPAAAEPSSEATAPELASGFEEGTEPPQAPLDSAGWDAAPPPAEPPIEAPPEPSFEPSFEPSLEPAVEAAPDAPALEAPPPAEPEPSAEALLPFDAEAASAVGSGILPEGWGSEPPSVEIGPPAEPEAPSADYGDLSPEQPTQTDALPSEEAQGLLAPLGAGQELTSDDDSFAQGFQLASNGSFGGASAAAAPAWSSGPTAPETEQWESAPSIDLGVMAPASDVPPLDLSPIAPEETTASLGLAPAPLDALDEIEVEEIEIDEGPGLEPAPPPPSKPAALPELRIAGAHRVVVHTVAGLVKRGLITDAPLAAATLPLALHPEGPAEPLSTGKVKAIFFMLAAGEKAPAAEGKKVRVTFNDGRQIAGFSPDYSDAGPGFFMIPADTRTNTGRIWVYRSAVKSVSVS